MRALHAVPQVDDHAVAAPHQQMATRRWDHRRANIRGVLLLVLCCLVALLGAVAAAAAFALALVLSLACVTLSFLVAALV